MKAKLVFEMPDTCEFCPCYDEHYEYCKPADEDVDTALEGRPDWCPLQMMKEPTVKVEMRNYSSGRYAEDYE